MEAIRRIHIHILGVKGLGRHSLATNKIVESSTCT